jgi:class 3 adenylate cyclase
MTARRERKVVTVLFADLAGFTSRAEAMDPEDVAALLDPYHARLKSELERFGGTVEKFIGDAVMAIFGAPVSHEDDAERAVRAALAIRDWSDEEGIELRVGVNTGEALITLGASPAAGGGPELEAALTGLTVPWTEAAIAFAAGDLIGAADICAEIGARTEEAYARLSGARMLVAQGRRAEADVQLQRALEFYRSVGATHYIRQGESLLAASA